MPFANIEDTVEFRFVNKQDPEGVLGLRPYSWNLRKDEHGALMKDADGNCIVIAPDHGPEDSYWEFVREMDGAMDDIIVRKTSKTNWKFDRKAARKQGRDYTPVMEQQTLMSGLMSLITTTSRGWHGPEFILPPTFKDESGRPHPLRGKIVQCNAYWISRRNPNELRAVELFLQSLYEPEGEDEIAAFQLPDSGVAGPEEPGVGAENGREPGWEMALSSAAERLEGR